MLFWAKCLEVSYKVRKFATIKTKNNLYDEIFVSEVVRRQLDMRLGIHHIRIVYWDGG